MGPLDNAAAPYQDVKGRKMKKLLLLCCLGSILFSGCQQPSPLTEKADYIRAIENFEWFGFNNKPFLEKAQVPGSSASVFFTDLDRDGVHEMVLQSTYAPWMLSANEVFILQEGQFVSEGGFYGDWKGTSDDALQTSSEGTEDVYETDTGEAVILRWLQVSSGGRTYQTLTQISLHSLAVTPLVASVSSYQDDGFTAQYFFFKGYENCSREFLEGDYYRDPKIRENLEELTLEDYEQFLEEYPLRLKPDGVISYTEVGNYNLLNLPPIGELEGAELDEYMAHREDPEVLAEKSKRISAAIVSNLDSLHSN